MTIRNLPLFDGFIETPFERRFQGLLRRAWLQRSWHVIVAEPGSGKTMGIGDLRDEAARQAGMVGGRRYPVLAVTAPKMILGRQRSEICSWGHWESVRGAAGANANTCSLIC